MERVLIKDLREKVGQEVKICGVVDVRRDQGKMAFFDLRDRSGVVQAVVFGKPEVLEVAKTASPESAVELTGIVNQRPEKMINDNVENGDIEVEITSITVLNRSEALPFDLDGELNLDTLLDNRPLTLKTQRSRDIFKVAATIVQAYRDALIKREFTEFQAPALVGSDAEGGAEVFKVQYFNDKIVNLATSPQLYKEIMTGAFERVFTIAKIFRAEKSATTRHLSEVTQMDFEMGFIKDHNDVMDTLEEVVRETVDRVVTNHSAVFERFNTTAPHIPNDRFPRLTLLEAQTILGQEYGISCVGELDLEPEHERKICEWAKNKHGSDFIFITEFPTAKRAFYSMEVPENPTVCRSFDLLFRGLEINSGAQRYHTYESVVNKIISRGMNPKHFEFYTMLHKYGAPPHGGCSTGLERFTARMLNIPNVKEAVPFPRDINRIDTLLTDEVTE